MGMDMSFVYSGGCCLSNWQAEEVDTNKWRMNLVLLLVDTVLV